MKKLGIIGCGWLGYRIAESLQAKFEIHTSTTQPAKMEALRTAGFNPEIVDLEQPGIGRWGKMDDLDGIIITVPLLSSRVDESVLAARRENLLHFITGFKGLLILMSSIGVYQNQTGEVTEACLSPIDVPGEGEVYEAYPRINILRLGGLMGDNRQLQNYTVREPHARVNHIHFKDVTGVVEKLLDTGAAGTVYNVVAPLHPTKADVISAQMGEVITETPATDGRIVSSEKLVRELHYKFEYPDPSYFHIRQM
ncbi:MAG: epimerase [Chitinophagaceae bacterium]|nr:MAG: epimerase [Chitinophagaceae bacterium]